MKEFLNLVLVFGHQSYYCGNCMLLLDFLLPTRIFLLYHISESITSKVVSG